MRRPSAHILWAVGAVARAGVRWCEASLSIAAELGGVGEEGVALAACGAAPLLPTGDELVSIPPRARRARLGGSQKKGLRRELTAYGPIPTPERENAGERAREDCSGFSGLALAEAEV